MPWPGLYNTGCVQGATYAETFVWRDSDGNLVDTTDCTGAMQVRTKADGDLLLSLSSGDGQITFGGVDGTIAVKGSSSDTASITPGFYVYDLWITSANGDTHPLVGGKFTVLARVTQ